MTCDRCNGTGMVEFTGGTHQTSYWMRGEMVTQEVEATEDRPVYQRCECRNRAPRVEAARTVRTFGEKP